MTPIYWAAMKIVHLLCNTHIVIHPHETYHAQHHKESVINSVFFQKKCACENSYKSIGREVGIRFFKSAYVSLDCFYPHNSMNTHFVLSQH